MPAQWITDEFVEWAPNETENFTDYWYGDGLLDSNEEMYVSYDAGQTPTDIYPPDPPKVRPPDGNPPIRPPSAPPITPPGPRIRRPKNESLPY